ncbi:hypothetical protein Mapa_011976 [Marchantia paleacea]|nr:hypothetical protein Mapa_011976 [Marchantia paleacea]
MFLAVKLSSSHLSNRSETDYLSLTAEKSENKVLLLRGRELLALREIRSCDSLRNHLWCRSSFMCPFEVCCSLQSVLYRNRRPREPK